MTDKTRAHGTREMHVSEHAEDRSVPRIAWDKSNGMAIVPIAQYGTLREIDGQWLICS